MSTHQRAWIIRAAVVLLAASAGLAVLASPAAADDSIDIALIPPPSPFAPGQSQALQVQVTNKTSARMDTVTISVNVDGNFTVGSPHGCNGNGSSCTLSLESKDDPATQGSKQVSFTITAKGTVDVPAGQTQQKSGHAKAVTFNANADADFQMNLNGPSQAAAVPQLSGDVINIFDGKPIANAQVSALDPANHQWTVGTDKDGKFKILATTDKPIMPGAIVFLVKKDTYKDYSEIRNGVAGQPITNLHFTMSPLVTPVPSSAAVSPGDSAGGVGSSFDGDTTATTGATGGGGGGLSWALIAIGGVLVALGIAAIVILLVRRKGDDEDEDEDDQPRRPSGPGGRGGPPPPPGGRGGPRPPHPQQRRTAEPTTVMRGGGRPGGPGPRGGADQTMIARSPLADMPTQLHGRVGPPGAPPPPPPPPPPGYGHNPYASGQYGGQQGYGGNPPAGGPPNPGYPGGAPPNYGQPDPYGNAYGPQQHQGGYGQQGHGHPGGPGPNEYDDPRAPRQGNPPPDRRVDWLDD